MNKLTKGQKDYKRRKQQGLKDVRLVEHEDDKKVPRITKRQLCVRVSQEAADRLSVEAEKRELTKQEMLTWLLVQGLPKYSTHSSGYSVCDHDWPEHLLNPEERTVRYKGNTGTVQLNLADSSTAWNKLECHKTATGLSKARIVQTLILNHRFLTDEQRERQRKYRNERFQWTPTDPATVTPPSKEEVERVQEALREREEEREEAWDQIFDQLKEQRPSQIDDTKDSH